MMKFKNLTIGKQIAGGFAVVLILLMVVGGISLLGFNSIVGNAREVIDGNKLDGILAQKEVDHLNWVNQVNRLLTDDGVNTLAVETDDHECGFGKWLYGDGRKEAQNLVPALGRLLEEIESPHLALHESALEIGKNYQPVDSSLGKFLIEKKIDHLLWMHKIKDSLLNQSPELNVQLDPKKCGLGRWIYSETVAKLKQTDPQFSAILDTMVPLHKTLHESAMEIERYMGLKEYKNAHQAYLDTTNAFALKTLASLDQAIAWHGEKLKGVQIANAIYAEKTLPALVDIQRLLMQIRGTARKHIMADVVMLDSAKQSQSRVIFVSAFIVVLGIFLSFFIVRRITRVLKTITNGIKDGSVQVGSAADQISSASQMLAESASEQAATVEETSAAIQEILSHSQQTSEMTRGTRELMNENIEKSGQSLRAIVEITMKINKIEADSDKIGMIIKNIDQIAFQTNLLALNAAVEAARAGEAGAGFAVVADEVRNLAKRSTEAAKSTQELLNETISRIGEISTAIKSMNQNFEGIVESATIIGEKNDRITRASTELAKGIEQISSAAVEMDTITQRMASNSEESAAAAEQLSAQAQEMGGMALELTRLVYGGEVMSNTSMENEAIEFHSTLPILSHGMDGISARRAIKRYETDTER